MKWQNPKRINGRFINPYLENSRRGLWDLVLWRSGYYDEPTPRPVVPSDFVYPAQPPFWIEGKPSAVWINHSTYLVQIAGLSFLTDPLFSSHCSPIRFSMFERTRNPAIALEALPQIDCVLLSHNHYDHLDAKSAQTLLSRSPAAKWIVPTGVKKWFDRRGFSRVVELGWGETHELSPKCRITAVPAQHFSGRSLWDRDRTLWCGYVVECGDKIFYFAGDTGYNPVQFKEIGLSWPAIDLSLIPIGVYIPKPFMQPVHICPFEAVLIHCDVRSKLSLGMHWSTFVLSEEEPRRPPYDLYLAMQQYKVPFHSFLPIEPGIRINW